MQVIKDGHAYQLEDGNCTKLVFRHRDERLNIIVGGVTTCDLLDVLIHRIQSLNKAENSCVENIQTLLYLKGAKLEQMQRKHRIEMEECA